MDPKSKEFQALQDLWYGKLKKSGFEDIEQDEDHLKVWSLKLFAVNYNETTFNAKAEYYRLASQFLHDYPFASTYEKLVWELHSNALSIRDIVLALKKRRLKKAYRRQVHETIQRLTQEMVTKCR